MKTEADVDDVATCVREGRAIRPGVRLRIEIGNEDLEFSGVVVDDPVLTGRQVIEAADKRPVEEHLVFQLLKDGGLENLRLEETVDLRGGGVERFIVFRSAESYRLELDGRVLEWGTCTISEPILRQLARVPEDYKVWQERRGQEDLLLPNGAKADLSPKELERFYTGIEQTTAGLTGSFLPTKDRRYLEDHELTAEQVEEGGQKGVVLRNYQLPDTLVPAAADLLILLPSTWPDTGTDMFYLSPWVKLARNGALPDRADGAHPFAGQSWQRWSRHNNSWRAGVDGIWTVLRRVDAALRGA